MHFALEDAPSLLAERFGHVERFDFEDELRVTEPSSLIAFVESSMEVDSVLRSMLQTHIQKEIDEEGFLRIGKQPGLMVATSPESDR